MKRGELTMLPYTVRGIELDASGAVSPGWLARILEHTRWRVFKLTDDSPRSLMQSGVARAGHYEYLVPLSFEEQLEIGTWVARVGRTSFDIGHRIVRVGDRAVAARARITIVNLEAGAPAPLDPIVASFVVDEHAPPARAWPDSERTEAWTREWVVRPSDQDSFRHVNQARYVDFIDDTRLLAAVSDRPAGLAGPLEGLSIEYAREARAGERVRMETWVTGDRARAFELTHQPSGESLARGQAFGQER